MMLYFTTVLDIIMAERRKLMPNIKPISDLRNYSDVLRDVAVGAPVFLTKNGRGRYAIIDIQDYEKTTATLTLMNELGKGKKSGEEKEPMKNKIYYSPEAVHDLDEITYVFFLMICHQKLNKAFNNTAAHFQEMSGCFLIAYYLFRIDSTLASFTQRQKISIAASSSSITG